MRFREYREVKDRWGHHTKLNRTKELGRNLNAVNQGREQRQGGRLRGRSHLTGKSPVCFSQVPPCSFLLPPLPTLLIASTENCTSSWSLNLLLLGHGQLKLDWNLWVRKCTGKVRHLAHYLKFLPQTFNFAGGLGGRTVLFFLPQNLKMTRNVRCVKL